jgi:predicted dehydrogenase
MIAVSSDQCSNCQMDYTSQSLRFKLRKAVRYARLYGIRRTRAKVESHYHMKKRYRALPRIAPGEHRGRHVGIIGCGKFAYAQIAYYLRKNYGKVICAAMDVDIYRAASLYERYGLAYYTDDASELIADPALDTLFVASNHASHAEYAIDALDQGKTVHIEKPHVVTEEQLARLCAAMVRSSGRVALGFNRPHSEIGRTIKAYLESQPNTAILNWFVVGHELPAGHWYRRNDEGGRILGNLCHWTDFIYQMLPPSARFPIQINPTRAAKADTDIAVAYTFGDGSIGAITFSVPREHAFEGVRERFSAHRGNVLIAMDDFKTLDVQVAERRFRIRKRHRDHGHERMICESYELGRGSRGDGCPIAYVWETAQLFLKTKEALETMRPITLRPFDRTEFTAHV